MKKVLRILGVGLIAVGVFFVLEGIRIINVIVSIHHLRFIFIGCGLAGLGIAALVNANQRLKIKPLRVDFSWMIQPEGVFLIIALVFGRVMCFLIPNQSGFDELDHLARIWEISGGFFIPNQKLSQGPYLPKVFREISYRNQFFYDPVDPNYFSEHGKDRISQDGFIDFRIKPVNFPTVYFPQAFAMGLLGRIMDAPVLVIYYTSRILDLLGYLLLTFIAIRLIPFGKWILTVLALAPIAVYQASTVSPDAYTNGACFLFIAWVLKLAFQENKINWKQLWITIGLTALLLMVKLNAAFLLPLLLLLVWRGFESRKMLPILAGAIGFFFLVFVVGWSVLVYSHYYSNVPGYGLTGQAVYIFSHPLNIWCDTLS